MMTGKKRGQTWTGVRPAILVGLAIGLLAGSVARADDVAPPSWRGSPLSLYAHWGFETEDRQPGANPSHNDFGSHPTAAVGGGASIYVPDLGGRKGVWVLTSTAVGDATISTTLPNADRRASKEIFIQVTYLESAGKPVIVIPGFSKKSEGHLNADADGRPPYSEDPNRSNPWEILTSTWTSADCPASETVTIKPPAGGVAAIDQLVIDTICRPSNTIGR